MSTGNVHPTTVVGIKRSAKLISRERGIPHLQGLDEAARLGGYENFKHAQNAASRWKAQRPVDQVHPPLYITFYWKDREQGTEGRETLAVNIPVAWADLITTAQMATFRAFADLEAEGPDHLVGRKLVESQERARRDARHAARAFHFMNATKLRPSSGHSRAYPRRDYRNRIPGADHSSTWYCPKRKAYVYVDEPYEGKADRYAAEREAWGEQHGYHVTKVMHWPGMYFPEGGSQIYLIADKKKFEWLLPYATALDVLPRIDGPSWDGVSAPRLPRFTSPGSMAAAERSQAPALPARTSGKAAARGATVGYVQTLVGPQRRPDAKMPIEAHQKAAGLLKAVLAVSHERVGVHKRVDSVRSELDEWVMREYTREELPGEVFNDLYYGDGPSVTFARALTQKQKAECVIALESVKAILREHYPDCAPLRQVLKKADAALSSLAGWASID